MGMDAKAILFYGVVVNSGDEHELPWYEYDDPIDWWIELQGYEPLYDLYTENGNYAEGFFEGDPRIDEHYAYRRAFIGNCAPLPFEVQYAGSYDEPDTLIIVPGMHHTAWWGSPVRVDLPGIVVGQSGAHDYAEIDSALNYSVARYNIPARGAPGWHLAAFWG